jgi:hypothetical protein
VTVGPIFCSVRNKLIRHPSRTSRTRPGCVLILLLHHLPLRRRQLPALPTPPPAQAAHSPPLPSRSHVVRARSLAPCLARAMPRSWPCTRSRSRLPYSSGRRPRHPHRRIGGSTRCALRWWRRLRPAKAGARGAGWSSSARPRGKLRATQVRYLLPSGVGSGVTVSVAIEFGIFKRDSETGIWRL